MSEAPLEFSRRVAVRELPEEGRESRIEATEQERASIARRLGLIGIDSLEARFIVTPRARGALARGSFRARVIQQCVVTLEPVANLVEGTIEQRFAPAGEGTPPVGTEVEIDALAEDPPEPLDHGAVELGELVVEYLALALDPYPRRADVQPELPHEGVEGAETPFAKLRGLKISATET